MDRPEPRSAESRRAIAGSGAGSCAASQPSRVASGRSFNTRSQMKSAVVLTFNPLGLRLCRNRIRGTAPRTTNSANGTPQSMVQAHAADLAQRFQDELVERNPGRRAQIIDSRGSRKPIRCRENSPPVPPRNRRASSASTNSRRSRLPSASTSATSPRKPGSHLLLVENMDDQHLVLLARELLHRGAPARRIEEIAHDHRESGMRKEGGEPVYRRPEIGRAGAGKPLEEAEETQNLRASPAQLERRLQRGRKRRAADAVEILQARCSPGPRRLSSRSRTSPIRFSRGRRASHGPARVDEQIDVHLFLGGEHLEHSRSRRR